ncbi:hypothetical protein WUBG_02912 [Wuchereria bancrofti]|uniref:Uncharacterized protein n=1 Tax=Wuchereria bancrofti TaxID=6293 RepID=J9FFR6_WUCBA|nr:hypothetical protein WUBG_02912 [Wuchereria bancrofti]
MYGEILHWQRVIISMIITKTNYQYYYQYIRGTHDHTDWIGLAFVALNRFGSGISKNGVIMPFAESSTFSANHSFFSLSPIDDLINLIREAFISFLYLSV